MNSFFNNKVVWITGASSGIGEALAYQLSKQGAKIIISARRENELERVKNNCAFKENVYVLPLDLLQKETFKSLSERAISKFGKIDILINNGGQSQRSTSLETTEEIERKLLEINYFSHVALSKLILPQMINNGYGQIVVISSIAGKFGFFLRSSYSAAKHALHGYFESLRLENFNKNIYVLLVCPGKIRTNVSLNAVISNGENNAVMEKSHETAMSADKCAEIIVKSIFKHKEEIFIGGKELKAVWIKRIFPILFSKLIKKQKPE